MLAPGVALGRDYDVTVIDADTRVANLLFHVGVADVDTTLHGALLAGGASVEVATDRRLGMRVVPYGTSFGAFE
jgi:septum site-determining protein MinD